MALTYREKLAGRKFRDLASKELAEKNDRDPPTHDAPFFIGQFRHLCPARNNRSTAIELKERYVLSPIYATEDVPAGRFGFIYREGRCRACGQTARSRAGRIVDASERPPLSGREGRSEPLNG